MTEYLIYFNQQWVGDHPEEWYQARGPLAMAVVNEMKDAGVHVFAGGLEEELEKAFSADTTSGTLTIRAVRRDEGVFGRAHHRRRARSGSRADVGRQDRRGLRLAPGGPPVQAAAAHDMTTNAFARSGQGSEPQVFPAASGSDLARATAATAGHSC
jgi:hypothetical protein